MKKIIVICILAGVFYFVRGHEYFGLLGNDSAAQVSENGFVKLPELTNIKTDSVIVFAPQNCPKEGAQRAEELVAELKENDIPVMRSSSARFGDMDSSTRRRLDKVMSGELPVVVIGGWGKANPTYKEVVAEYKLAYE